MFRPEPMGLDRTLFDLDLGRRITYDGKRDTLFLNFEGMRVRTAKDVDDIRVSVEGVCREIGHRVPVVVNYDHFRIDPELVDAYAAMVRHMEDQLLHRGGPLHRQRLPAPQARRRAGARRGQAASVRDGGARAAGGRLKQARQRNWRCGNPLRGRHPRPSTERNH